MVGVYRSQELAPAKVNLSLLVGPVQPDGYHPVFTIYAPVDLFDRIEFTLSVRPPSETRAAGSGVSVECAGVEEGGNLIERALSSLADETGWSLEGTAVVDKRIPIGAGLGGGSSDAATALLAGARAVSSAGGPDLGEDSLQRLARALGADVPFFLDPRISIARGVGDILQPLFLPELFMVLVLPTEQLSTAEVYRAYDRQARSESHEEFETRTLLEEAQWRKLADVWAFGEEGPGPEMESGDGVRPGSHDHHGYRDRRQFMASLASLLRNDLESPALSLLPDLERRKGLLGGPEILGVLMSGSGPSLFALCLDEKEAERAAISLGQRGLQTRVARTLLPA